MRMMRAMVIAPAMMMAKTRAKVLAPAMTVRARARAKTKAQRPVHLKVTRKALKRASRALTAPWPLPLMIAVTQMMVASA